MHFVREKKEMEKEREEKGERKKGSSREKDRERQRVKKKESYLWKRNRKIIKYLMRYKKRRVIRETKDKSYGEKTRTKVVHAKVSQVCLIFSFLKIFKCYI